MVWGLGILWLIIGIILMIPSPILGTIVLLSILFYFDLILPIIIGSVVILAACVIYALIDQKKEKPKRQWYQQDDDGNWIPVVYDEETGETTPGEGLS